MRDRPPPGAAESLPHFGSPSGRHGGSRCPR